MVLAMPKKIRVPEAATVKLLKADLEAIEELKTRLNLGSLNRTDVVRLVIERTLRQERQSAA